MTTLPPDPAAAHETELRSEDDGMPVNAAKDNDPAGYAKTHEERERAAASGYPSHPQARAVADANHIVASVVEDLMAPRNRLVVAAAGLPGFGLAALLLQRSHQTSLRRFASRDW